MRSGSPRHILIIRAARLGDALFTTPAVTALHDSYPEARLSFLSNRYAAPVLKRHPALDQVFTIEPKSLLAKTLGVRRLARRLHRDGIDLIVPLRDKPLWRKLRALLPEVAWHEHYDFQGRGHIVERHLDFIAPLLKPGAEEPGRELVFSPSAADRSLARRWQERSGALERGRYVAFQPCYFGTRAGRIESRRNSRAWPLAHFAALGRALIARGTPVIVLGAGPGERRACAELVASIGAGALMGHGLPMGVLGALMGPDGPCKALVSIDTGPLHLAVAVGLPVLALYGPTDPGLSAPWCPRRAIVLRQGLPCSPCKGTGMRCYDNVCLKGLSPAQALEALEALEGVEGLVIWPVEGASRSMG